MSKKTIIVCLLILNLLSISSIFSSLHQAGEFKNSHILYKQIAWIIIGWLVLFVFSRINYRIFFDLSVPLYVLNILLLLSVYIIGREIMGAKRWLSFLGLNFQPSELSKLVALFILGRLFSEESRDSTRRIMFSFFLISLVSFLIFIQPDLGTSCVCMFLFFLMGFFSRVKKRPLIVLLLIGILCMPIGWRFLRDYQKKRLLVFINPYIEPQGAGYTIIQSKIAIGSGRFLGRGFLAGTQNQFNFLPERHTDFIFTVIAEERGFLGSLFLILLYYLILKHILAIGERSQDEFGRLLCRGIVGFFFVQIFVNLGMTMGLLPVVGLPLLFVSYGGTHLLFSFVMIGIVFNIEKATEFSS